MATVTERRLKVRDRYKPYIGRNHYSQARRDYCEKKYSNGKYYSDCSSSVSYAYKGAGEGFGILRTTGMYSNKKFKDVPVKINANGTIANPEVLEIGDMLLFAGTDTSRKEYGYVGHVEMVGEISGKTVWLYGHGSGLAKRHEMNAYCKSRHSMKASTPLGHRGLIKVRRAIYEDGEGGTPQQTGLRKGDTGAAVKTMQDLLLRWDTRCLPKYGADGDFGGETEAAVKAFQTAADLPVSGVYDAVTDTALLLRSGRTVRVTGGTINVRTGPGTQYPQMGTAKLGAELPYQQKWETVYGTPWYLVEYTMPGDIVPSNAWVSGKYTQIVG